MKVSELRPCDVCAGKIYPLFYRLRVSQALVDHRAVNEVLGMHQFFGGRSLQLAEIFSPHSGEAVLFFGDKDKTLETELFICQDCYLKGPIDLAMLSEQINERRRKGEVEK